MIKKKRYVQNDNKNHFSLLIYNRNLGKKWLIGYKRNPKRNLAPSFKLKTILIKEVSNQLRVIVLQALRLSNCSNLHLRGLTHVNSPRSHIYISNSENVTLTHLNITAPESSPNTDGIDLSSSKNVSIHESTIATGNPNICYLITWFCSY